MENKIFNFFAQHVSCEALVTAVKTTSFQRWKYQLNELQVVCEIYTQILFVKCLAHRIHCPPNPPGAI